MLETARVGAAEVVPLAAMIGEAGRDRVDGRLSCVVCSRGCVYAVGESARYRIECVKIRSEDMKGEVGLAVRMPMRRVTVRVVSVVRLPIRCG